MRYFSQVYGLQVAPRYVVKFGVPHSEEPPTARLKKYTRKITCQQPPRRATLPERGVRLVGKGRGRGPGLLFYGAGQKRNPEAWMAEAGQKNP